MKSEAKKEIKYDDQIDLREIFTVLWTYKIKIIAITTIFAVGSVIFSLSLPNQYKSTALLAPAQSDGAGLSGALGSVRRPSQPNRC